MINIQHTSEIYKQVRCWQQENKSVGVVPTMGALHPGHLSLIEEARKSCDRVVATIFVNPTQFAAGEDFEKYPRTFADDCDTLQDAGCDALFAPEPSSIYAEGHSTYIDPPSVAFPLEGQFRPTHFRGVTTIVLKLLQLVPAERAFFGEKDFQQVAVIRAMVRDLSIQTEILSCPIVRERDGLAMSSRNRYLTDFDRKRALSISQSLRECAVAYGEGNTDFGKLEKQLKNSIEPHVDSIDYACIAETDTLSAASDIPKEQIDHRTMNFVALVAAYVGSTRLIDNMRLN